jgi:hypothetical protein
VEAEDLSDAVVEPLVVAVEPCEAADVDAGEVAGRLAFDDPLGERTPGAPGGRDAHRVEPRADEEPTHLRRLAEEELVVRGEALGAVVELPDAGLLQGRNPEQCAVHEHREVVPVLLEQLELEGMRDLVGCDPRLGRGLEPADHKPTHLFLEVGVPVRVPQDRQVRVHALERLGDDVEVLGGVQRDGGAHHRADLLGPLAGAVDDDLGLDVAGVGAHTGHPAVLGQDVEDAGPLGDPGTALTRALGQCGGEVRRVRLPVTGQPDGAEQVLDLHDRVALRGLLRCQQLALEAVGVGGGRRPLQLHHPVRGPGDGHPAALLVAGREPDLGLQVGVELGGVLDQPGAALRRPQLADQPRRVPGGAGRELSLLEQQDVGPPELREVVGDARPDHPAADDDDPGTAGEIGVHAPKD